MYMFAHSVGGSSNLTPSEERLAKELLPTAELRPACCAGSESVPQYRRGRCGDVDCSQQGCLDLPMHARR